MPDLPEIYIVPLVPNLELLRRASARTRAMLPPGNGVQDKCLPFTAGSGLVLLILALLLFGHCPAADGPEGCRVFLSPLPAADPHRDWVFYVQDNPPCRFERNAYTLDTGEAVGQILEPGIS